jgi:hypothetical protein
MTSVGGDHRDRIDDHAAFRALHLVDFGGLLLDGEIAMNNAEPALLRQRDGHVRLGDRVHGGADDGNVEADVASELRLRAGLRGNYIGARRQQKNVIESKSFGNGEMNHKFFGTLPVAGDSLF